MSDSRGRNLLESTPEQRIEIHRSAWPASEIGYQRIVGVILSQVLEGIQVVEDLPSPTHGPARVSVLGLSTADTELLDERLPPPVGKRNQAETKTLHRRAIELPRSIRLDPMYTISTADRFPAWIELTDGATMVLTSVISPIMNDLATVFRIREGQGPKTLKGSKKALEQSIKAHQALGLDWTPIRRLLDPTLDAASVVEARRQLVEGWSKPGNEPGEAAMALLSSRLAESYYRKARKDGTAIRSQVLNTKTTPALHATLRSWDSLVDYLGENLSDHDSTAEEPTPVQMPAEPPPEIAERVQVARRWFWEVFDSAHAAQMPGSPSLWGLVPSTHPSNWYDGQGDLRGEAGQATPSLTPKIEPLDPIGTETHSTEIIDFGPSEEILESSSSFETETSPTPGGFDPNLWLTQLKPGMADSIQDFWGSTFLARYPGVLVDFSHPESEFARILDPVTRVWEDVALTCWFLCFGPHSLTTLDGLEDRLSWALDELSDLECPVNRAVFSDLISAGGENSWLFTREIPIHLTICGDIEFNDQDRPGAAEVFLTLRDIVSEHRRAWLETYLDDFLERLWMRDLETASASYREFEAGRSKPPTVKQACAKLEKAAKTWFGGDLAELAKCLGISGPVSEMQTVQSERGIPGDMKAVRARVNELVGGNLYGEGSDRRLQRRRFDLSLHVDSVLTYWQASGELPSRAAFGKNWLLKEAYPEDFEQGYSDYVKTIRIALSETGHPAADAPMTS